MYLLPKKYDFFLEYINYFSVKNLHKKLFWLLLQRPRIIYQSCEHKDGPQYKECEHDSEYDQCVRGKIEFTSKKSNPFFKQFQH